MNADEEKLPLSYLVIHPAELSFNRYTCQSIAAALLVGQTRGEI